MLKNQSIILGIDPGARQIGVAVVRAASSESELLYYGVKTLKKDSLRKSEFLSLELLLTSLMEQFNADFIALEKVVSIQQRNSFVQTVYWRIKTIAQKHNFEIKEYSSKFARSRICGKEKGTRQETYTILARSYPELRRYLLLTKDWQKSYFAHLFDSVAVALLCVRELNEDSQISPSPKV